MHFHFHFHLQKKAAAGSPFGIGSDLAGSVRAPAFYNGIFGHKPSPYVVSFDGIWPDISGQPAMLHSSTTGPMCRFACDLLPMLKIMAGDKAKELRLDEPVDLSKINYFYQENDGGGNFVLPVEHDIQKAMEKVVQHFQNGLGANVQRIHLEKLRYSMSIWDAHVRVNKEYAFDYAMANFKGRADPIAELLKWSVGLSKHTAPALWYGIYQRFAIQHGSPTHQSRLNDLDSLKQKFDEMLGDNGVLIYPVHSTVAPYHNETILMGLHFGYQAIVNALGYASTAVPLGLGPTEGLPIGLQVIAKRNQDRLCLAVACELERVFGGWVAPEIIA